MKIWLGMLGWLLIFGGCAWACGYCVAREWHNAASFWGALGITIATVWTLMAATDEI